jgi:hypothetical protein
MRPDYQFRRAGSPAHFERMSAMSFHASPAVATSANGGRSTPSRS